MNYKNGHDNEVQQAGVNSGPIDDSKKKTLDSNLDVQHLEKHYHEQSCRKT